MSDGVKVAAEQAYGTIVAQLAAPYFFEKLAANGVQPRTEKEAAEMWEAATKLHVLFTAEQEKAAAAQANDMTAINAQLDQMLAASGFASNDVVEKSTAFKQAAVVAAEQPDIAKAVLTLQAAAAAALQSAE